MLVVSLLGMGGAERHMETLANELASRHRILLVYLKESPEFVNHVAVERLEGLVCLKCRAGLDIGAVGRLTDLFDDFRPDVVLCANAYPLVYVQLARLRARHRSPRVVEVYHTTVLQSWRQRASMLGFQPLFWAAHHLVYVCHAQETHWRKRGLWARRQSVIHNGVDTARFDARAFAAGAPARRAEYGFRPEDLVVGVCAVMRPEKAHGHLLQAMATAGGDAARWKALFIGDGPLRDEIESDIERLGLRERVRITGYRSDVRPDLAVCDAVALVSVAIETFSIAALEAMSMSKPLIMSDIGGAREQVVPGATGWLFPPGDIDALAALLRDIRDAAQLRAMGARAREVVLEEYSLTKMIDRYDALIREEAEAVR